MQHSQSNVTIDLRIRDVDSYIAGVRDAIGFPGLIGPQIRAAFASVPDADEHILRLAECGADRALLVDPVWIDAAHWLRGHDGENSPEAQEILNRRHRMIQERILREWSEDRLADFVAGSALRRAS